MDADVEDAKQFFESQLSGEAREAQLPFGGTGATNFMKEHTQIMPTSKKAKAASKAKAKAKAASAAAAHGQADQKPSSQPLVESALQMATALLPEILKEAGEAKGLSIQIAGHALSSELVSQLKKHSDYLFAMYRKIQTHANAGCDNMQVYQPLLSTLDPATDWYTKRRAAAKAMAKAMETKKAKVPKKDS